MDSFIGEVRIFAFSYAPMEWALCDGSLMQVVQNQALYSILWNTYGGVQNQTFGLPDLRCRAVIGATAPTQLNVVSGADTVTLGQNETVPHSHSLNAHGLAPSGTETQAPVAGSSFLSRLVTTGTTSVIERAYCKPGTGVPDTSLSPGTVSPVGSGGPHENRQPLLAMNFCISLSGEYPVQD